MRPLSGPLYVVGFSMGTVAGLGAFVSGKVERAVLLALFTGMEPEPQKSCDISHFLNSLGALDMYVTPVPQPDGSLVNVPGSVYTAAMVSGACVKRSGHPEALRASGTQLWCVLGADDTIVDAPKAGRFCESLGGRSYMYDSELGIGHSLSPETGNPLGMELLGEIVRFFVDGSVREVNLVPKK